MSKKFTKEIQEIDRLKSAFEKIHRDYPKGGYDNYVAKLATQRAEAASKIGRKK